MKRIHLFEFEDFKWFPDFIRDGGTDFLGFILKLTKFYEPILEVLAKVIKTTKHTQVLDLCSGNGGPIEFVCKKINHQLNLKFILSDKYPNFPAYKKLKQITNNKIDYCGQPLDVLHMDIKTKGVITMFSAIHHFEPNEIRIIFKNVVKSKMPVCIFDSGDKHIGTIVGILFFHPIIFFFCTPFIRPFKFSRIIFTYLIPVIPIYTIWDGIVSILRLYNPDELLKIAKSTDTNKSYDWKCGSLRNKIGFSVMYLTGTPKNVE